MSPTRENRTVYLQPAFVICAAVLALAGAGMSMAKKHLGLYLKKEPLPLKKPLASMDKAKLAPYRVVDRQTIEDEEVLKKLGTEDYIQWVLEDAGARADSTVRNVLLFITYYELPDRVPHVPEECYTGAGYECLDNANVVFWLGDPEAGRGVPGRYLAFGGSTAGGSLAVPEFPVLYLFRVNGQYAADRGSTRFAMNVNVFSRHSYFCKIELAFNQGYVAPTKADAVEASEKLLTAVLPLLEQEHWPD